jgi:electron transfer flavoprotein alpha subunit
VGGPEGVAEAHAFAQRIGATLAATRKVTDLGWMPSQAQVGLSGRAIAPHLYFTLGISGGFNHTVGIQRAGTVVAINNNPEAPMFKQADYGIVADWRAFVSAMDEALAV